MSRPGVDAEHDTLAVEAVKHGEETVGGAALKIGINRSTQSACVRGKVALAAKPDGAEDVGGDGHRARARARR